MWSGIKLKIYKPLIIQEKGWDVFTFQDPVTVKSWPQTKSQIEFLVAEKKKIHLNVIIVDICTLKLWTKLTKIFRMIEYIF